MKSIHPFIDITFDKKFLYVKSYSKLIFIADSNKIHELKKIVNKFEISDIKRERLKKAQKNKKTLVIKEIKCK
jgi:hypothetical protein